MRLGIGSYTYGWAVGTEQSRPPDALTALGLIGRAKSLGVRIVQLCDNLPADTWEEPALAGIASAAQEAGVAIEVGTSGSSPEHLSRCIGIAARLGSPILRLVVDAPGDHPDSPEVVRRLGRVVGEAERRGVAIAIENHDRFRAKALVGIVRELPPGPVGVCLDTVNSFGALEGPEVVVETLGPYVLNLHLKDFAVVRLPHLQGFTVEGRPLGTGMLDVEWLLARLREFGRDPSAIVELWTPPEPELAETVRKEAAWARQSVTAARRWIAD